MLGKIKKKVAAFKNKTRKKVKKSEKKDKKTSPKSSSRSKSSRVSWRKKIVRRIRQSSKKKKLESSSNLSSFYKSKKEKNALLDSISALVSEEKVAFSQNKYRLGEIKEKENVKIRLPQRYFDNRIVLMVRDPWWLYTYWDISPEREKDVRAEIPLALRNKCRRVVRVYEVRGLKEEVFLDIEVENIYFGNWYINVNKPEAAFCVEIGYLTPQGRFYSLARSNIVSTPYFGLSNAEEEEWILPEEEYLKILGLYNLGRSSLEVAGKIEEIFRRQISSFLSSSYLLPSSNVSADNFFFELATELIIYGRTEPDATLKLGSKKVPLAKDGTFRLRFLLPEGKFSFPFEASSSSGKHKVKVSLQVERFTL
ncbi:MAG: DUF4912 domain-containing protein [Candidatus Omnitrophica bacterium]|nr:DUF4912 domain-containing protein [Candidatus Omnitrophota bacterium]